MWEEWPKRTWDLRTISADCFCVFKPFQSKTLDVGWIVAFLCKPMGSMTYRKEIALGRGSHVLIFAIWKGVTQSWKIQDLSWGLALEWEVHTLY